MLLYTHAVNDARTAQRQLSVNSFWISGSGALPDPFNAPPPASITVPRALAQAAFSEDWAAYTQAWATLDATEGARLLALQQGGEGVRLSLCGEHNAIDFETAPRGIFTKLANLFGNRPLPGVLEAL
jgi:hypothetical protein